MEQVLDAADTGDAPYAFFELGDLGNAVNFATQDDGAVLAIDVHVAFGHVAVAEQLALDPLAERLIVGNVRRSGHQVHDAVRNSICSSRRPTPQMPDASASALHSCHQPIAQHVAAPSTTLSIQEIHS